MTPASSSALLACLLLLFCWPDPASARIHRSGAARDHFKLEQPCPANGLPRGPCPGWIIDHISPLCAGGADAPVNMQWQTVEAAKAKDRLERLICRR